MFMYSYLLLKTALYSLLYYPCWDFFSASAIAARSAHSA